MSWVVLAVLMMQHPETMSLLEKPLYAPRLSSEERSNREEALAAARAAYGRAPASVDAAIVLSRAQMALGQVGDALEVLTRALERTPDDAKLQLERGRGLTVIRKFELAVKELRKPAETLPAGSCALGIAQYLAADYRHAREAFRKCPDPGVFAYLADWRTGPSAMPKPMVSRQATPDPAAAIRLPGAATKPGPTTRMPLAAIYLDAAQDLLDGRTAAAKDRLKQIVEKYGNDWMDPIYIAAEADYTKIVKAEGKRQKAKRKK